MCTQLSNACESSCKLSFRLDKINSWMSASIVLSALVNAKILYKKLKVKMTSGDCSAHISIESY